MAYSESAECPLKVRHRLMVRRSRSLEIDQLLQREASDAQVKPGSVADAENISPCVAVNQAASLQEPDATPACVTPTPRWGPRPRPCVQGHLVTCSSVQGPQNSGQILGGGGDAGHPIKFGFKINNKMF